jgi:protein TonB
MELDESDQLPQSSFFKRIRAGLIIVLLLAGLAVIAKLASSGSGPSRREAITIVSLPPPPPPPPPQTTPPPVAQQEQRMEEPMIKEPEAKAEPPKEEPPLGTGIKGNGSDSFGLGDKAGNGRIGDRGGSGSRWGWYANQVASRIQQAMLRNRKTRSANLNVSVRVWPDASGRVARAQLASSTGDLALDKALRDEVLNGLQLQEPPPSDMPSPILLQVRAQRPH